MQTCCGILVGQEGAHGAARPIHCAARGPVDALHPRPGQQNHQGGLSQGLGIRWGLSSPGHLPGSWQQRRAGSRGIEPCGLCWCPASSRGASAAGCKGSDANSGEVKAGRACPLSTPCQWPMGAPAAPRAPVSGSFFLGWTRPAMQGDGTLVVTCMFLTKLLPTWPGRRRPRMSQPPASTPPCARLCPSDPGIRSSSCLEQKGGEGFGEGQRPPPGGHHLAPPDLAWLGLGPGGFWLRTLWRGRVV